MIYHKGPMLLRLAKITTCKHPGLNLLCVLVCLFASASCQAETRPNMVLFLADDCTYRDIGCYGSKNPTTPALDGLAEEGMRFNRCYQAAPMCSPTRHNLFTGVYPVRTGAYPNHTFADDSVRSLPHYLQALGYRVGLLGKWHIGPREIFPFERLGDKAEGKDHIDMSRIPPFIRESLDADEPFCLVVCSHQPHGPHTLGNRSAFPDDEIKLLPTMVDTPPLRNHYSKYLAEVNFMDGQVAELLQMLDDQGVAKNTLVVFLSEQGSGFPYAKWTCYEDGVRSAMIVRWPGVIDPGTDTDALVEYNDIVPTFIDAAGGKVPEEIDGVSLMPIFRDPSKQGKPYAFNIQTTRGIIKGSEYYGIRAVTDGRYRYIYNLSPEMAFQNGSTVVKNKNHWWGSWLEKAKTDDHAKRLVENYLVRPGEELYDLQADPDNLNNLADDPRHAGIKKHLREVLLAWMRDCGDEGLETELMAFQRMKAKRSHTDPVFILELLEPVEVKTVSDAIPSGGTAGYLQVPRDGYYTFYKKRGTTSEITVAGEAVVPEDRNATYGIIGLKKGRHALTIIPGKKHKPESIKWSGPGMNSQVLSNEALAQIGE